MRFRQWRYPYRSAYLRARTNAGVLVKCGTKPPMRYASWSIASVIALLFTACGGPGTSPAAQKREGTDQNVHIMDPHSHARPEEAVITHLSLDLNVDMEARRLKGTAAYAINRGKGDTIRFDTDGLTIHSVKLADGTDAPYTLGDTSFLGRELAVKLPAGADSLIIAYETGPGARALQWLSPGQTADKTKPFLFTQGQAILTRTWIPVQDSPGIRFTYDAKVTVPNDLMAVMSATNPQERNADGVYHFRMDKAIPAYLVALAVGDIVFKPIDERTGIYAERTMIDKAVWEFADMGKMVSTAETLYGPYRWGRYDVIVLPPSFPFGGMENPMLTFATPTVIAGDRSLTALIAHELAHSWSGNLVTNATWNDFWLNEGFTVYFEHRITEELYGPEYNAMTSLIGHQDLMNTVADMEAKGDPGDTRLKLDLAGRDPDDGMTDVAYEKGFALLRLVESRVGREKFDAFLRGYFDRYAFQSMTTERFITYLHEELLDPANVTVDVERWVYQPGIPEDDIVPVSDRFTKVEEQIARWGNGTPAKELATQGWSTFEWIHFLRHLPKGLEEGSMADLDRSFGFMRSGNTEILAAWLEQCILNDYDAAYLRLDEFLRTVGRRKFLIPLYQELVATEKGRTIAEGIYAVARPNYHSVSVRTIDAMLGWEGRQGSITL